MNKTGEPPHVPGVDEKKKDGNAQPEDKTQGKTPAPGDQNSNPEKAPNKGIKTEPELEAERIARTGEPQAKPGVIRENQMKTKQDNLGEEV